MPDMNGLEATREIKKIRKNLLIVAQTAFSYNHEEIDILEAGCLKVLTKPIIPSVLLDSITEFLR